MKNASFLNQKIRVMALMEMVFAKPSDSRQISFQEISTTCHIPVNEVCARCSCTVTRAVVMNVFAGV